jgi:hypothetical protein
MNALIPVLCAIAGALVYALANPKLAELGRLLFMASVFALMFALAGRSIHLF